MSDFQIASLAIGYILVFAAGLVIGILLFGFCGRGK